jgi:inhibitor of cysteine peptidase
MTRIAIVVLHLLLFSLMLVAQPPQSPGAQQKSTSSAIAITDQDNGKDIDLPAGDTLVLRLKSNPSTGYSWAIKGDTSPLRLVKSSAQENGQNSHVVGAPVTQEFRLRAVSAGMASLTLEYRRPWEHKRGSSENVPCQGECALKPKRVWPSGRRRPISGGADIRFPRCSRVTNECDFGRCRSPGKS